MVSSVMCVIFYQHVNTDAHTPTGAMMVCCAVLNRGNFVVTLCHQKCVKCYNKIICHKLHWIVWSELQLLSLLSQVLLSFLFKVHWFECSWLIQGSFIQISFSSIIYTIFHCWYKVWGTQVTNSLKGLHTETNIALSFTSTCMGSHQQHNMHYFELHEELGEPE